MINVPQLEWFQNIGKANDKDINIFDIALNIALQDHPGISTDKYYTHINTLTKDVKALYEGKSKTENAHAEFQLSCLKTVLHDQQDYNGDDITYDDLQNADIMRVIDRRKGLPVALSILYITIARKLDWNIDALNTPGHVFLRLEAHGERLIFDPFNGCKTLNAPELRMAIKKVLGQHAELSASYMESVSNRALLIRLLNNIKFRSIEHEDYQKALYVTEIMRAIDPKEYRLLLDAGVLYAKVNAPSYALPLLERYIHLAPDIKDKEEAAMLLHHIKKKIH